MDSIMKEFEYLVVKLEEVKSATDNFNDTKIIGKGGFGYVYEGELSQGRGKTKAAFKRLDRKHGQGNPEFWKEVMMLSRYTHENLISLLGYCNEGGEMILVYEHASNGSLDRHLSSTTLTWTQRIRICHDAAKGLCYLHEDKGNHQRVLHRDIKSSNILLDENWKAKVSDMGLAKVGPSNMYTFFITTTVGTLGYIDQMYLRMGCLTKESDVYSFGVVLFEVLCGRLCFDYSKAGNIVHIWKQRYEENKLDKIMFKDDLVQALHQSSLEVFSKIAFQCLEESREKRPKMSDVVEKLETALKFQEPVDLMIPKEYQEIVKTAVPPLIYRSVEELKVLLSKGVLLNGRKTVKKEIGYMWNSEENVEKLRNEAEKLKNMKERVEQKIKQALDNGDELVAGVEKWVNEALAHISTTEEFLQEADAKKTCFNLRICVNLNSLHHYGKEAKKKVLSLEQHQRDGAAYEGDVSVPTPSLRILELYPRENIDDLADTHKYLLEKITRSVLDENIHITGIFGIGGVGKTTLAIEVAARVKNLFALVVFVTISQHVDAASIKTQVEIAVKRIYKGEKVLIILDDVWTELKLHEVGIPCGTGYPSCKILLTSRQRRVCTAMNAQVIIWVESLPFEEGWILFKRVVGERVETDAKLKQVARKVVDGCGGLPLILQVVGKALKDKDNFIEWEEALVNIAKDEEAFVNMAKDETSDIGEDLRVQFALLKLSYDDLKSEEVKLVFLLCSMFPEDFNVPLERLAYYCVGLQIFTDLSSLEAARNKVKGAVKILKSSCLLLDGKNEFTTKMHDVVRDLALLIASTGDYKFLVEARKNLTEWLPRNESLESYTGISLMFNDIRKLPDYELNIPRLKIFLMQGEFGRSSQISEISDEFTQAMKKVEVIDFEYNRITSLPKSLNELRELRMLNLSENTSLFDVSILGELNHLEILILSGTGITEIPQEIGKLVNLRLFHVKKCPGLSHIAPGVLSNLRWLEELSIGYYPVPVEKGKYNSLVEISKLLKLTFLDLHVPHICLFPEGYYLTRLKRFSIHIGGDAAYRLPLDRNLILNQLDYLDISHLMHVRKLIEACNGISLSSIKNLDNIMPLMSCEGLGKKFISLFRCDNLMCLVDSSAHEGVKENTMFLSEVEEIRITLLSSLKVIWNCPNQYISLHNLVRFTINFCPKLEKLFTVSVAQGLVNLQRLEIWRCDSLKEMISDGDEETSTGEIDIFVPAKNIMFHRLAEISLAELNNLTSFYTGNTSIKFPSLVKVKIKNCHKLEKWGYGTHDAPNLRWVNYAEANGFTIDEMLAKDREARELRLKQRHNQD